MTIQKSIATLLTVGVLSSFAAAQVTLYGSRASFNAAAPGTTLEDLEGANVSSGSSASFTGPIDSSTNNGIFSTGSVKPGIKLTAINDPGFDSWFLANSFGVYGSKVLSTNYTATKIQIEFSSPNIHAFGTDLYNVFGGPQTTIDLYSGSSLISSNLVGISNPSFFGATSVQSITKVIVYDGDFFNGYDGVDNIAFGAVPEPSSFAVFAVAGILVARRRRG